MIGRLQVIASGAGFVLPESGDGPDIFVRRGDLNTAVHGDRVRVRVRNRGGRGPRGVVAEVLERAHSRVVGRFEEARDGSWVRVTEPRLGVDVFIPAAGRQGAASGELVWVQVTDWGDAGSGPAGRVERVLGRVGEPGVDVLAIQLGQGLADEFPGDVQKAAVRLQKRGVRTGDLANRTDCREQRVVTIDPADARDHDDALSFEPRPGGGARIGIHIADVSHYVPEGGEIDGEAWERGTSVYLVDRVLPMLPHELSSSLCSLVPGRDRLTVAAFLDVDATGAVQGVRLERAVIRSSHRLSYEEAQNILDGSETPAVRRDPGLAADLRGLLEVSRAFRRARRRRGSLDFDLPESHVVLDDDGAPVDVRRRERLPAHMLVEDLMIAANEAVARWSIEAAVPVLYRIHEDPAPEKLDELRLLAREFDLSFPRRNPRPRDYQRLLDAVQGRPEEPVIAIQVLKSLARARYAPENGGHFGLASPAYLHFTSPIRRYPDLLVHRQLLRWLDSPAEARSVNRDWLDATARHASRQEERATRAERDSVDLKKAEFMERHVGERFEGVIAAVARFGFFVRLNEYDIEGLVHETQLWADEFRLDPRKHTLTGEFTGKVFRVGDPVTVRVSRVDREARKIDFAPV